MEWLADVGARLRALVGVAILAALAALGWLVKDWMRYHETLPFRFYFLFWFIVFTVLLLVLPDVIRTLIDWGPAMLRAVRWFVDVFFSMA